MRFILFVIDGKSESGSQDEMAAIDSFNDHLEKNGHWITAAGITAPEKATLIDNRGGNSTSVSGSLFNQTEFYSGFWIIEAKDADTAHALAMAGSQACNRRVELRPFLQ